jgi:hypothetical protein
MELDTEESELKKIELLIEGSKKVDELDLKRDDIDARERAHTSTLASKNAQAASKTQSQSKPSANG